MFKNVGPKKFKLKNKFSVQKIFGLKKFGSKKSLVQKNLRPQKELGTKSLVKIGSIIDEAKKNSRIGRLIWQKLIGAPILHA